MQVLIKVLMYSKSPHIKRKRTCETQKKCKLDCERIIVSKTNNVAGVGT